MKAWYASKTIWGALVMILAAAAQHFGMTLSDADQQLLTDALAGIATTVGGVLVIWGRVTASKKIGKPNPAVLALALLPFALGGCTAPTQFQIETYADALAAAEVGLQTAYNSIAVAKRNQFIDAARRDSLIADADKARAILRPLEASPQTQDWSSLKSAQALLRSVQQTLLEIQNGSNTQSNSSGARPVGAGRIDWLERVEAYSY